MRVFKSRAEQATSQRALGRDETMRLPHRDQVLRVANGCVLVTREGDPEDHVLGSGEELRLPAHGRAVAWALAPSTVLLAA